jgi:molecular chaperone DnaK (HSP70)
MSKVICMGQGTTNSCVAVMKGGDHVTYTDCG